MLGTHSIVRWGCFFLMLLCGCQTTQKQARQSSSRDVREPGHSDTARASRIAYAHRPSGVRFPLVFAGLGQRFFHNFEQKSKGAGVAVGYKGALVTLTLYIYNSRHRRIPDGHKNALLKEAYKSALKGIAVYSRRLGFQSLKYHGTRLAPLLNSQPTPKAVYSMFSYKHKGAKDLDCSCDGDTSSSLFEATNDV